MQVHGPVSTRSLATSWQHSVLGACERPAFVATLSPAGNGDGLLKNELSDSPVARNRTPPPDPDPELRVPLAAAQQFIDDRIQQATAFIRDGYGSRDDFEAVENDYYAWDAYNEEWLRRNVGEKIATEYAMHQLIYTSADSLQQEISRYHRRVHSKVAKLESIRGRLELWADNYATTGVPADIDESGPVFVVHGSDLTRAEQVARMVERSTSRDAVILHEEPNQGRTILEKFEHHAAAASFAIVLLTADDEGRRVGTDEELRPRGRQNVVLELGFFFGRLGRGRVVVLVDPSVERPSDIDGLVYVALDDRGAWKQQLARELQTADIPVNVGRIP